MLVLCLFNFDHTHFGLDRLQFINHIHLHLSIIINHSIYKAFYNLIFYQYCFFYFRSRNVAGSISIRSVLRKIEKDDNSKNFSNFSRTNGHLEIKISQYVFLDGNFTILKLSFMISPSFVMSIFVLKIFKKFGNSSVKRTQNNIRQQTYMLLGC